MPNVQKVSIALTPEIIAMLKEAVDTGEYTSTSEVVREALRGWKNRRHAHGREIENLRNLWQEGLESGPSIDADAVFERLQERYAERLPSK